MPYYEFVWTLKNRQHIADNYVSIEEAEDVVLDPVRIEKGRGNTIDAYGYARTGRLIKVVFIEFDEITAYVLLHSKETNSKGIEMQRQSPVRHSSHSLLTPERQAELDALGEKFQTEEAREQTQRDLERVAKEIETQHRIDALERELKAIKEQLKTLTGK